MKEYRALFLMLVSYEKKGWKSFDHLYIFKLKLFTYLTMPAYVAGFSSIVSFVVFFNTDASCWGKSVIILCVSVMREEPEERSPDIPYLCSNYLGFLCPTFWCCLSTVGRLCFVWPFAICLTIWPRSSLFRLLVFR